MTVELSKLGNFVYFGTSEFSAQILQSLLQAGLKPILVVTNTPKPIGRNMKISPTPVAQAAQSAGLKLLEVTSLKKEEIQKILVDYSTHFAILAAFGKIIPQNILNIYPKGIINVHPSFLPLYRGPSPIQSAIYDGNKETGVSLIILDEEVDHGPILMQDKCTIEESDDYLSLANKLATIATRLLLCTLPAYLDNTISPVAQDHTQATFTKMISREDGQANFAKTANELNKQRQAFMPWPGLWTRWNGKRLKLIDTSVSDIQIPAGQIKITDSVLLIGCSQDSLRVHTLQLEGGKILSAADFIRGHKNLNNTILAS